MRQRIDHAFRAHEQELKSGETTPLTGWTRTCDAVAVTVTMDFRGAAAVTTEAATCLLWNAPLNSEYTSFGLACGKASLGHVPPGTCTTSVSSFHRAAVKFPESSN